MTMAVVYPKLARGPAIPALFVMAALVLGGCGKDKWIDKVAVDSDTIPVMPMPMPGQASLTGVVRDSSGQPVAGATVKIAETDATATSDGAGAYQLAVPSDSTVTIATSAAGFATSFRESVMLASQSAITGFDVLLLSPAQIMTINGLGAPPMGATFGLMAVRLHSTNPACLTAGARISVWPPKVGTVIYSRPSATGGLDEPDATLAGVQAGARIDAWVAAALSPGSLMSVTVQQAGCQLLAQSPSMNGLIFPGLRRPDNQALTEADLFLN